MRRVNSLIIGIFFAGFSAKGDIPRELLKYTGDFRPAAADRQKPCLDITAKPLLSTDKIRVTVVEVAEKTEFADKGDIIVKLEKYYPEWNEGHGEFYRLFDHPDFVRLNQSPTTSYAAPVKISHESKLDNENRKIVHSVTMSQGKQSEIARQEMAFSPDFKVFSYNLATIDSNGVTTGAPTLLKRCTFVRVEP